ncbi:MAG: 4-hydroxy-tetrahydrodipicolinate synthase [Bacteroidia bacterium]
MSLNLKGTGVAVVTPFDKNEKLDANCLSGILNHLVKGSVEYLVLLGTTGESVTVTEDEKHEILRIAKEMVNGRIPLILGIGGNNTQSVLDKIRSTDFSGISGLLSVGPYYNKPSQTGIYQHYMRIADHSPVPVILYNVPARTSSNISASTTLALAKDHSNIIGMKEASGNFDQCMEIISGRPDGFFVISGDDLLTLPLIATGFDGVISVIANAFPQDFSDMTRASLAGDFPHARTLHYKLLPFIRDIFAEGNPSGIKALLTAMDLCENHLRLPMSPISTELYDKMTARL